jgi:hypothetical protein
MLGCCKFSIKFVIKISKSIKGSNKDLMLMIKFLWNENQIVVDFLLNLLGNQIYQIDNKSNSF